MKKLFQYSIVLLAAGLLYSCSKTLDRDPLDKLDAGNYWNSESDASRALTGCYSFMRTAIWGGQVGSDMSLNWEALSDNAYAQSTSGGYRDVAKGAIAPTSTGLIPNVWNQAFEGIAACNNFLENIGRVPGMADDTRNRMRGEAMFLRAWYYNELTMCFGDVPLLTSTLGYDESTFKVQKSPRAEVVKQMLSDLDSAVAYLPNTAYADGHAVKGTALGYKARVLLYSERWAEAEQAAKAVITDPQRPFRISDNYMGIFFGEQNNNPEIMFSIKYSAPDNLHTLDQVYASRFAVVPIQNLLDAYECTDGKLPANSSLYNPQTPYLNRDPRLKYTVYTKGDPWPFNTNGFGYTGQKSTEATSSSGFGFRKYINPAYLNSLTVSEQDFIKLRYADVLLMYAEAMVMQGKGNDPAALAAVNEVRARKSVNMPPVKSLDIESIRRERRVELAFEGLRYYDLKRWKIAATVLPAVADPDNVKRQFPNRYYYWPVPQAEVDIMGNDFQNPDYR
jgi:hypothetical protein